MRPTNDFGSDRRGRLETMWLTESVSQSRWSLRSPFNSAAFPTSTFKSGYRPRNTLAMATEQSIEISRLPGIPRSRSAPVMAPVPAPYSTT